MKLFSKTIVILSVLFFQNELMAQYTTTPHYFELSISLVLKNTLSNESLTVPMGFSNARFSYNEGALTEYFSKTLSYPQLAFDYALEGTVVISFRVNTDGSLSDLKIEKPLGLGCDKIALQAVENMPNWIPAQYGSQAVTTKVFLPIDFELE